MARATSYNNDRSYIKALATRVGILAEELVKVGADVRVMTDRGDHRDESLKDIRQDIAEGGNSLDIIAEAQRHQLTPSEVVILRAMILGKDRADWVRGRWKYYFLGTIATLTAVWALRDFL